MGRTALYRDPDALPPRAQLALEPDAVQLVMPDGRARRHELDGREVTLADGWWRMGGQRRFVRMLLVERWSERHAMITPPDRGAVAPSVLGLPPAPVDAAILDPVVWDALSEFVMSGGRLGGRSIADLARLAAIATPQFAIVIGEVAAQRALELAAMAAGPMRGGGHGLEAALAPLADVARTHPRAAEALVAALAHATGLLQLRSWRR